MRNPTFSDLVFYHPPIEEMGLHARDFVPENPSQSADWVANPLLATKTEWRERGYKVIDGLVPFYFGGSRSSEHGLYTLWLRGQVTEISGEKAAKRRQEWLEETFDNGQSDLWERISFKSPDLNAPRESDWHARFQLLLYPPETFSARRDWYWIRRNATQDHDCWVIHEFHQQHVYEVLLKEKDEMDWIIWCEDNGIQVEDLEGIEVEQNVYIARALGITPK